MGILSPVFFVARSYKVAANLYLAGQVSFWIYKTVQKMRSEKLKASELRARFVEEYTRQYGKDPDDCTIGIALRSYNAIEKPVEHRVRSILGRKNEPRKPS